MKKQKKTREWRVGTDDAGRPVLLWDASSRSAAETAAEDHDPLAQTFDFLTRLEVPELKLEGEPDGSTADPYDHKI